MLHEVQAIIERATTTVNTETLARQKINDIRVLSESKFVHLVRRIVDEIVSQRFHPDDSAAETIDPGDGDADEIDAEDSEGAEEEIIILDEGFDLSTIVSSEPAPAAAATERTLRSEIQGKWDSLRRRHLHALETLEERLASLGAVVQDIELAGTPAIDLPVPEVSASEVPGARQENRAHRRRLISRTFDAADDAGSAEPG